MVGVSYRSPLERTLPDAGVSWRRLSPSSSRLILQGWLPRLAADVRQHKRFYDPNGERLHERYQHLLRPWQPQ